MNIALFEDSGYRQLLPLTWLRPAWELHCGRERLSDSVRQYVAPRIARLFLRDALRSIAADRTRLESELPAKSWAVLNGRALFSGATPPPPVGGAWMTGGYLVAAHISPEQIAELDDAPFLDDVRLQAWCGTLRCEPPPPTVRLIEYPWDLVLANGEALRRQFHDGGVHEGRIYPGAHLLNPSAIRIHPGSIIKPGVVLDAEEGPIEIDRDVTISPNAVIEGPCYIGPHTIIRAGAYIRANTSIGPHCRIGGEVEGSIIHGYSNKQHDGFLGHSYVGEWVNLGAGTINSDLKNTYGTIRVPINGVEVETGQRFVGATIGDHAKTGIGTILPTGCVIGVAANLFTRGAVPKFVPSFSWLTDAGMEGYRVDKAIEIARTVMGRRRTELTPPMQALLEHTVVEARRVESAGWA